MEFAGEDGYRLLLGLAGSLAISVSVALAVRTCRRWLFVRRTFNEGLSAEGRVLDTYVLTGGQGRAGLEHAVVGFRAADGRQYRLDLDTDRRRPLDERLRLRYLPSNPERAVLAEAGRGTVRAVVTLLFLLGLGVGGAFLTALSLL
ncbi:DUF3592 domain-containing protein [Streptomyces erythrochromogenes]|uniref:DUF3592 domain-containing protein n=1 Tax=Streptomyces erythrochromogenes TaxID=285574 RepID=UPI003680B7B8